MCEAANAIGLWNRPLQASSASESGRKRTSVSANPGTQAIGLVFDGDPGASDFHFRFAQNREEIPYPKWHHCDNPSAEEDMAS